MSDYIRGHCFTNLDDFRGVRWPTQFVAIPRIGDCVEGLIDGDRQARPTLKVVRVTHQIDDGSPRIRVELHR